MAIAGDVGSFDPYHSLFIKGYYKLAYDSLVNLLPNGEVVSGLAEKWNADARSATFTLRSDVTCSDGSSLTARQVAADLTYAGDAKNQSSLYGSEVPSVPFTATGDDTARTVKIKMSAPYGFTLRTIGMAPIVCAKGLTDPKSLASTSAGTGPFVLVKAVPGQSYTFTVRKGYKWGPGGASTNVPGLPAKVVLRIIPNETTASNLLLAGQLNWALVAGDDRRRLDARGLANVTVPAAGAWLWFNHLGGRTTADKRVRQALVQALDLDEVIRVNTGGTGTAATGLVAMDPKPCPGDTVRGRLPRHDVLAAQATLEQAGWIKGADGIRTKDGRPLSLDLHYSAASSPDKPTAELLAQRWKAIGVRTKINADSITTMNQVVFKTSNYDIYMQGLGTTLPTVAVKYVSGPVAPKGVNIAGIDNKTYQALAAKATTMTPPQACTYWNQAEQALYRDVDLAPIANRPLKYYLNNVKTQVNGYDFPIPTSIRVLR
jgi:peptide/nickel transport system substrate-binding protein